MSPIVDKPKAAARQRRASWERQFMQNLLTLSKGYRQADGLLVDPDGVIVESNRDLFAPWIKESSLYTPPDELADIARELIDTTPESDIRGITRSTAVFCRISQARWRSKMPTTTISPNVSTTTNGMP